MRAADEATVAALQTAATDWLAARGASTIDEPALIDCV